MVENLPNFFLFHIFLMYTTIRAAAMAKSNFLSARRMISDDANIEHLFSIEYFREIFSNLALFYGSLVHNELLLMAYVYLTCLYNILYNNKNGKPYFGMN